MTWPEETPDAIIDEIARAVVDFLAVWASAVASSRAEGGSVSVMEGLAWPRG